MKKYPWIVLLLLVGLFSCREDIVVDLPVRIP